MSWNIEITEDMYKDHLKTIMRLSENIAKIKKIAQKHYNNRYDTDWDDMQKALMKIWRLTK